MQSTKDTFYAALRDRLAQQNPARVITINGVTRPAVLVSENAPDNADPAPLDCFILHWTSAGLVQAVASNQALWRVGCRVAYATVGADAAGADRGRALAALDRELATIAAPRNAPKKNYAVSPPADLGTNLFWSQPQFTDAVAAGTTLARTAEFTVFFFSEVSA